MPDLCALHQVFRPEVREVHTALTAWGGIVVHFSGVPPGVNAGLNLNFPDDLLHVLDGKAQGGISCSTVRPGDAFEGNTRNSWGCIGVIVRGRTSWSLAGVDPNDCGSSKQPDGLRYCIHADRDLTLAEVIDSLDSRSPNDCNEWVVRDYDALGVLIQPPCSIRAFGTFATKDEIVSAFSQWPLFTITLDGLYELTPQLELASKIPISKLYPN